jgi:hypothetical protein
MVDQQGFRRAAEIFQVATGPTAGWWRVRFRRYFVDGNTDWVGGKILWGHDQADREDALIIAYAWIRDGVMPESDPTWPLLPDLTQKERDAKIKAEYRSALSGLCLQTSLSDEEFWVQQGDLTLEALGDLARIKVRRPS